MRTLCITSALIAFSLALPLGNGFAQKAAGDFNGDGYDDLAIGVPGEPIGAVLDVGSVCVLYGGAAGLQAVTPDDQLWHQNLSGVPDANESGDHFGRAVASGDFNGDGYDDLAIGAPDENIGAVVDAGTVITLYGSSSGLQATGVGGPTSQVWYQSATGIAGASETSDHFGYALTTADFDGDGYDDLAIGVPDEDIGATTDAGAVNILLGSPLGLDAGGNQLFDQTFIGLVEAYDKFGSSLTAGDFENDGYEDLAVGVPYEDVGTLAAAGAVNIFHGSDIGLTSAGAQEFNQNSTSVLGASETSDLLGFSVAAGFFNGDFYADLAIGAPGEAIGTLIGAGCVNVLYGSAVGLQASNDQLWFQDVTDVDGTSEAGDVFGSSLCAADFTGDGASDLAIGVPDEDIGATVNAGAVNVLFGSYIGLQAGSYALGDQLWDQTYLETVEADDRFGADVFSGDFNGDTIFDLSIGVPCETVGALAHAGQVNILAGTTSGLTILESQAWTQNSPGVRGNSQAHDHFGWGGCADLGLALPLQDPKGMLSIEEELAQDDQMILSPLSSGNSVAPLATQLEENYPNPFNPRTKIAYSVGEVGPVRLTVFNSLGELVAKLVDNQSHATGQFVAEFDATNLASGMYFSRLEARGIVQTKRMVLVK